MRTCRISSPSRLREAFDFRDRVHEQDPAAFAAIAPRVRGIVASGEARVTRELLARLPAAEIIAVFGVGYDGIDLDATRDRRSPSPTRPRC